MSPQPGPPHDSAHLHVSGRAHYADDIPLPAGTLHAAFGMSSIAHGRVLKLDLAAVQAAAGVIAVFAAQDIPGENNYGSAVHDDPIFAPGLVQHVGQPLFAVVARQLSACAAGGAAGAGGIRSTAGDPRHPCGASGGEPWCCPPTVWCAGARRRHWRSLRIGLSGSLSVGGQDHFYLEGQIAAAIPQDDGGMLVHSSTQHPSEVQQIIAHALGVSANLVTVQCRRMGGGFGGKETQPALIAAAAAVMARATGRPVKLRLDRDVDMEMTGKRHDFICDYQCRLR